METNNNLPEEPFGHLADQMVAPLRKIIAGVPKILKFDLRLPRLSSITDIGGRGVKMKWPAETVRLMRMLPKEGIFLTGIEGSDPVVEGTRRNQLKEAFDFEANYEQRLQRICDLGIKWLRFGIPYSQAHLAPGEYRFDLMDKVAAKCQELGITILADLLHFGLPDWAHETNPELPYFQNPNFPHYFAEYVREYALRYPQISYFTVINEPYLTAYFSAKRGIWNETRASQWEDDRDLARATANIARAAILGRQAIEQVWQEQQRPGEPLFLQNDSFEQAVAAPGSNRQQEAARINLRRFSSLDLIFGYRDEIMRAYLLEQGLPAADYDWFMVHGATKGALLGIDHYPSCNQILEADGTVNMSLALDRYQMYELTKIYWDRYKLPLLHTETNGRAEVAEAICRKTYEDLKRLQSEGYPIVGMGWYGDEYQIGWHSAMTGAQGFEEYPVGLHYKGQPQPVALLFRQLAEQGIKQPWFWSSSWPRPGRIIKKISGIVPPI